MANPIKSVACIGTGTMGHGVALSCAQAGYQVKMFGRSDASLERGFNSINQALKLLVETNLVPQEEVELILERIKGVKDLEEACEGVDFLVESAAEDLSVKKELFQKFSRFCPQHAILATNTSGLSPTAIAEDLDCPERMLVTHFWNPPHLIPLVEIVPNKATSQDSINLAYNFILSLNKKPVILKREIEGFIGNRLQLALFREALYLVETGVASPQEIDDAVKYGFGRRLSVTGPLESADLGGLDIFLNISTYLFPKLSDSKTPFPSLEEKVRSGNLGSKTGKGFYDWNTEWGKQLKIARQKELIEWLHKDKLHKDK
ncbi:MAG TPA: 3-hydroxyacyl-CoA dehydrogenase family protein [Clostridia bacterium]|jgi:3-hydroxybutyryl-CoA dehydrogenase|nr:3-hydroxyacyl-CoA dehydrogenase family protein [Clostridia bacterium]